MNTQIISIDSGQLAGQTVQTVNARDLHAFLEVGKDFSTWIKERISEYGFVKEADFTAVTGLSSPKSGSSKARNQRTIDYHLSLDMAKELAMVEKTAKGREARRYFIDCERRAKAAVAAHPGPAPVVRPGSTTLELVEAFLAERVVADPGQRTQCRTLHQAFLDWCRDRGVPFLPSSIAFGRVVGRRFSRKKVSRVYWLGLTLCPAIGGRAAVAALPGAGFDASFSRRIGRLSSDFYDGFREALMRCDALYREHRLLLRERFPRAEQDHDVAELLRNFEGAGLSMIETADDSLNAALRQMRSTERIYRLAARTGA